MRWNSRPPFARPDFVDRIQLRRAASRYADHGWAVTPGAWLARGRFVCDRAGCQTAGSHPALERWQEQASTDPARIAAWWRSQPWTVLLTTGQAFDVLDVPAHLGLRALGAARLHAGVVGPGRGQVRGPAAVTPTGRWMFFVRPGDPLRPELDECLDVVRHGPGSWVPAAPSRQLEGRVRWAVTPEETRWQLPDSYAVQAMMVDALGALGRTRTPAPLPRQVSTARRAA